MLMRSCDQLKPNLNQTKSKWKTIVEYPLKLTVDNDEWVLMRSCDQSKPNLNQTKSKWKTIVEYPLKFTVDNDEWDHVPKLVEQKYSSKTCCLYGFWPATGRESWGTLALYPPANSLGN